MKRRGVLGTIALFLVVVIMLGLIGGAVWLGINTKWYTDWGIFTKTPGDDTEKPEEGKGDNSVQDGDGATLTSGSVYALPQALVYSATTAQSNDASEGIRVTATVSPSTAANKNVTWSLAFENAESEWARGKVVTDYFTAVPEEGTPNTVLLTCVEPFGEQIVLTAASEADPQKTASCTVDYRQKFTNVSLNIGNVPVNLGGDTNVSVDLSKRDTEKGGKVTLSYELTDTYTIAETITKTSVQFTHQEHDLTEEWFSYAVEMGAGRSLGITYKDFPDGMTASSSIEGTEIYLDLRLFEKFKIQKFSGSSFNNFADMSVEELVAEYKEATYLLEDGEYIEQRKNTKLWDIQVKIESGSGINYENKSALHWISYTGGVVNVALDQESIVI